MSDWRLYLREIKRLDSDSDVVSINTSTNKIKYSNDIIQHRNIENLTKEEIVRTYLVVRLVKELKYDKNKIELEKEYAIGRPKESKARLDILVNDNRNGRSKSFMLIEVKSPDKFEKDGKYTKEEFIEGQLFKIAAQETEPRYLIYYTCEEIGSGLSEKKIIIDYHKFNSFDEWQAGGNVSLDQIPIEYGVARKRIYVNKANEDLKKDERNLSREYGKKEFFSLKKDLHDVLWGGGGNYNYIFSNLIKLFLTKIYDEETTEVGKSYRFQIGLKDDQIETPKEVYKKINDLFKKAQIEYLNYDESKVLSSVGIDTEQISESKVTYVVEKLQGISLTENKNDGDLLGDFFESIVNEGFKQNKGQFFTHTNIVRFMLRVLDLDTLTMELLNDPIKPRLPYICDPSCGSGTFLIEAMKFITKTVKKQSEKIKKTNRIVQFVESNFPKIKENIWAREFIYGIEKDTDLGLTTKVNMILHGDGNINIFINDGLQPFEKYISKSPYGNILNITKKEDNGVYSKELNEQFDVIMSNPPFSIPLDTETKKGLDKLFQYSDKKNSENLFLERWYQLLRPGGRMAVVLPDSVFDTKENLYIRLFIYKYFKINALVSLPNLAFAPYTPTKTSLLFATKKTIDEIKEWEALWRKSANEFGKLDRRLTGFQREIAAGKGFDKNMAKSTIIQYIKDYLDKDDLGKDVAELYKKYSEDIAEIRGNPDWWIFGEIAKKLDYVIFMAEAKEIGFKRTKRGEKERPNDLFQRDGSQIVIDTKNPKTILDYIVSNRA